MAGFFWNHRLVKVEVITFDDGEIENTLQFCEVSYDEDTKRPIGYTTICTVGNTVEEMLEMAERLKAATALPVLELSDFPDDVVAEEVAREVLAVEDVICINPIPDDFKRPEVAAQVAAMLDAIAKGAR